jgi:hypothetical protein
MSDPCEVFKAKFNAMKPAQLEEYRKRLSEAAGIMTPGKAMQIDQKVLDEWACLKAYMQDREQGRE